MRFSELLADLALRGIPSRRLSPVEVDPEIPGLTQDTREVPPGGLFVAISGMRTDAHTLVPDAVAAGASSLFLEREVSVPDGVAAAIFADTRLALAWAAAGLYGHPTEEMAMVGVTGTDGKSTTCVLTVEALRACGVAAGGMNSLDFRCLDQIEVNHTYQTTLDATVIQDRMRRLADAQVETAVLETTSHGIDQQRVAGVAFDVAAYTNLTHEHLDYHGTLEPYRDVKLQLAELARQSPRKPGVAKSVVYNADEPHWQSLGSAPTDRRLTYGIDAPADVRAVDIAARIDGISFAAVAGDQRVEVRLPITGRFNVANALCALTICLALGHPLDAAAQGLATARGLRGRMEVLDAGQPYAIVIDYAHTPDGLEKVLGELRPLTQGRLLTVFGAPGDRDATKRPLMGSAVAGLADEFVITSDDPATGERLGDLRRDRVRRHRRRAQGGRRLRHHRRPRPGDPRDHPPGPAGRHRAAGGQGPRGPAPGRRREPALGRGGRGAGGRPGDRGRRLKTRVGAALTLLMLVLSGCNPPSVPIIGKTSPPKDLTAQDAAKNVKGTIYLVSGGRVWRLRGGSLSALTGTDRKLGYPTVSADGKTTAVAIIGTGHSEIAVGGPDFADLSSLTTAAKDPHNGSIDIKPAFSPDGSRLAFMSDRSKCCTDEAIWEGPWKPYKPRQVSTPPDLAGGDDAPAYINGGAAIVFVGWRPVGNDARNVHAGLQQAAVAGGKPKAILAPADSDALDPAPGPSNKLAFVRRNGDSADIEVGAADGSNSTKITSVGDARQPVWSPDGQSIIFISRHGGSVDLWSISADGKGDPQRLTWGADLDDNSRPAWIA